MLFAGLILILVGMVASRQTHGLKETRINIFVDLDDGEFTRFDTIDHRIGLQFLTVVIKNILRDQCYEARLYSQLERNFVGLSNTEKTQSEFDNLRI